MWALWVMLPYPASLRESKLTGMTTKVNSMFYASVNTWFVAIGPDLYVPTSMILGPKDPAERGWVSHVREDPRVRVRLTGVLYERQAVQVSEAEEYDMARTALEAKYEMDPKERDPERQVWIFRMDPRSH